MLVSIIVIVIVTTSRCKTGNDSEGGWNAKGMSTFGTIERLRQSGQERR